MKILNYWHSLGWCMFNGGFTGTIESWGHWGIGVCAASDHFGVNVGPLYVEVNWRTR